MMTILFLLMALASLLWAVLLQDKVKKLQDYLRPIASVDLYVKTARGSAESELAKARKQSAELIDSAMQESGRLEELVDQLRSQIQSAKKELDIVNEGLRLKSDEAHLLEVGYYEPVYGFEDIDLFREELLKNKESQKEMLRANGETGDRGLLPM